MAQANAIIIRIRKNQGPRFNAFLGKARQFQPESPSVFGGDIMFERGSDS